MRSERRPGRAQRGDGSGDSASLSRVFWAHAPGEAPARPPSDLETLLRGMVEAGRAAWPGIEVEPDLFVRYVAERLPTNEDPLAALGEVHGKDLYLACACALGLSRALSIFDREWMPKVVGALKRVDSSPAFIDDTQQLLRQKLFIPHGDKPAKIADYSGRGPLAGWLRAAAVRTGLNLRAMKKEEIPISQADSDELPVSGDPELDFLRGRYQAEFKQAFHGALGTLSDREINVLRMNVVDGLNIDKIGVLYKTHRSTVARWMVQARKSLLAETRRRLAEKLKLRPSEIDSLMRMIRTGLSASISQYLRAKK